MNGVRQRLRLTYTLIRLLLVLGGGRNKTRRPDVPLPESTINCARSWQAWHSINRSNCYYKESVLNTPVYTNAAGKAVTLTEVRELCNSAVELSQRHRGPVRQEPERPPGL